MMWCPQAVWGEGANFKREFKVQRDESEVPTMSSASVFVFEHHTQGEGMLHLDILFHLKRSVAKMCFYRVEN